MYNVPGALIVSFCIIQYHLYLGQQSSQYAILHCQSMITTLQIKFLSNIQDQIDIEYCWTQ